MSHQLLDSKGPKRRVGSLWGAITGAVDVGKVTALVGDHPVPTSEAREPDKDGAEHEMEHGASNGTNNGIGNGHRNGGHDGSLDGSQEGAANRRHDGPHHGPKDGAEHRASDGSLGGRLHATLRGQLEHELGVKFYVVKGVATPFKPGQRPLTPEDHATAFLTFLQDHEFAGNKVHAETLEEVLYPHFAKQMGWEPHSWRTVASRFRKLPGVRARQTDGRKGPRGRRHGPSPRVYYIPRP